MASNLGSIGFRFGSKTSFMDVIPPLADDCAAVLTCNVGDYAIWRSVTGAELWFHLAPPDGDERDVLGLTPFYEGRSQLQARVETVCQREDDNAFEGLWRAHIHAGPDNNKGQTIDIAAVDYAAHATRTTPFDCELRLCGFAQRVDVVQATDPKSNTGMSSSICGRIAEHRCLTNEVTGQDFHWLLVDYPAGKIDVVADPAVVCGELTEGAWANIACRFFGRLLRENPPGP